jgi:hypothetical protein
MAKNTHENRGPLPHRGTTSTTPAAGAPSTGGFFVAEKIEPSGERSWMICRRDTQHPIAHSANYTLLTKLADSLNRRVPRDEATPHRPPTEPSLFPPRKSGPQDFAT